MTPPDIRLVICPDESRSYYSFTCKTCFDLVRKPASKDVSALLIGGGVIAEPIPPEALETHQGAPISYDDILDFALWIEDDGQALQDLDLTDSSEPHSRLSQWLQRRRGRQAG